MFVGQGQLVGALVLVGRLFARRRRQVLRRRRRCDFRRRGRLSFRRRRRFLRGRRLLRRLDLWLLKFHENQFQNSVEASHQVQTRSHRLLGDVNSVKLIEINSSCRQCGSETRATKKTQILVTIISGKKPEKRTVATLEHRLNLSRNSQEI